MKRFVLDVLTAALYCLCVPFVLLILYVNVMSGSVVHVVVGAVVAGLLLQRVVGRVITCKDCHIHSSRATRFVGWIVVNRSHYLSVLPRLPAV
jgi:hypothetical protein